TGANGFLGHMVVAALSERLADGDGCVVALVRADSDAAARSRLDDRLRQSGLGPLDARVEVRAADLMTERFGLDAKLYDRLAEGMDAIVHCGALVNHALSYAHLYRPNVEGTAEAMRLAVRGKAKSIHFASTTGVAAGCERDLVAESASA